MDQLMSQYNALILKEDELYNQIDACKTSIDMLMDYLSEKGDMIHLPTVESIITSIHTLLTSLERKLLHLRIEKGILSSRISRGRRNVIETIE